MRIKTLDNNKEKVLVVLSNIFVMKNHSDGNKRSRVFDEMNRFCIPH